MQPERQSHRSSRRCFLKTAATVAAASTLPIRGSLAQSVPPAKVAIIRDKTRKVINGFKVDAAIVRQLVDRAVMTVAGVDDIARAWGKFVKPGEKVAVKFNGLFRNASTHGEVINAVTQGMMKAGVKADHIIVYDRSDKDLKNARVSLNRDGNAPRIYGTENDYGPAIMAGPVKAQLSKILLEADALINLPIMKTHCLAGVSGAMKNHLGSVKSARMFHSDEKDKPTCLYVADLNALEAIRKKTRLCICDALYGQYSEGPSFSRPHRWDFYGIIASTDMVALDTVLADIIKAKRLEKGMSPQFKPLRHLERAVAMGLGQGDLSKIQRMDMLV